MQPHRSSHGAVGPGRFMVGAAIDLSNARGIVGAIALGTAWGNLLNRNALPRLNGSGRVLRIFAGSAIAVRARLFHCGSLLVIGRFHWLMGWLSSRVRIRHLSRSLRSSRSQTGGAAA